MSRNLWYTMVRDSVAVSLSDDTLDYLYQRCAVAWGDGYSYYHQAHGQPVDLTMLYEQYKLLQTLTGDHNVKTT